MMKNPEIEAQVRNRAQNRFEVSVDKSLALLAEPSLADVSALKLRRVTKPDSSGRTVLLAVIDKVEDWKTVSRWTAQVRDMLPEPDTSDLYLILLAEEFSSHNCSRIEADEKFCRKYVTSSLEEIPSLLDRTFLAPLSASGTGEGIVDPVTSAFQSTQAKHAWLTNTVHDHWLRSFLSEKQGKDLVPDILETIYPEMDF
nr:ABC-three component system middle component 1 [uncultured Massilia sp.]